MATAVLPLSVVDTRIQSSEKRGSSTGLTLKLELPEGVDHVLESDDAIEFVVVAVVVGGDDGAALRSVRPVH